MPRGFMLLEVLQSYTINFMVRRLYGDGFNSMQAFLTVA